MNNHLSNDCVLKLLTNWYLQMKMEIGEKMKAIARMKAGRRSIQELVESASSVIIIHYSCESFYDIKDGRTPRITSIAVRYFSSAQTISFSIHKIAEKRQVPFDEIEKHYDELERTMLDDFFAFVDKHQQYKWVHWNMRDANYGFSAIEHRYEVLKGSPHIIPDANKKDLSRILIDIYGGGYIGHPRLEKLMEKNKITLKDFLTGKQEAYAFENKEYVKLHQSTLRKVDILHSILLKAHDDVLAINTKWYQRYGVSLQGLYELAKDYWWAALSLTFLGAVFAKIFDIFFVYCTAQSSK